MGSRFLAPGQLAALFRAAGAQRVDVHLDGMNAQLVIGKTPDASTQDARPRR